MQKAVNMVSGVVIVGHRVASGPSKDYPYGSLVRQIPIFKARGLDLDPFFKGTLNISIAPFRFELVNPAFTFRNIAWTEMHPPEDFSFSPCSVSFQDMVYDGYIYYPHPETKVRDFQDPSIIEVITTRIPGVGYGSHLKLTFVANEIRLLGQ